MNPIGKLTILIGLLICLIIPSTIFSQTDKNIDLALQHFEEKAKDYNLTSRDITNHLISDNYTSKHNGVTHIYFQQQHENINVRNAITNINVLPNGKILNMGNRFYADLANRINTSTPSISSEEALQKAMEKFLPFISNTIQLKERKSEQHFIYENAGITLEPIPVQLSFEPMENKTIRLVWQVELYQLDAQHWWEAQVDAVTGQILSFRDKVIHCSFDDPNAGCKIDHVHTENHNGSSAHADHKNSSIINAVKSSAPTLMGGTYNILPIPLESPNHGVHALVTDPADPTASPFGWHDTDGADGPEFTITRGNNVHAYQDIFNNNASLNDEPDGGALLEFDFPFDPMNDNPYTQVDAAVVNLFYWNNVVHDLWYQYGFDEVSGNFQENNYGNGGIDEDYVRAEALDGSGTNNANFAPTVEGGRPRMQMFIWSNDNLPEPPPSIITVTAPAAVADDYESAPAGFGGELPTMPLEGELVLVDDGIDTETDACEPIINGADISGKIALIDRGDCEFGVKMLAAENEGAIAVIICQNVDEPVFGMGPGAVGDQVTIPGVMISLADCNLLKMNQTGLMVSISAPAVVIPTPGPAGRDGDFDNGIIAHEFTHGISNRLTGGPNTGGCLTNFEQAGEGWSDWFGLVMQTTSANDSDQPRGIGTYAIGQPVTGDGIRDFPYSRDLNVDSHTYADINNVSVPHGVGSVWAVMIWDLYWNMVDVYGFDDDLYNGTGGNNKTMQLVLDGLKLQACNPTFLDARDAVLAADVANFNGDHQCLIWETFARRGLGVDAVAGGGESFDTPGFCNATVKLNKTAATEVMAGEVLTYTIEVRNDSQEAANDFVVTDDLPAGTELVAGSVSCGTASVDNNNVLSINIGDVLAGDVITCTYDVLVASTPFSILEFEEGVENGTAAWETSVADGPATWETSGQSFEGNFAWFAENIDTITDMSITTVASFELTGASPALSFWHRYNTESTWDGGVVEISTDGGNFWDDLEPDFIQNGYNANISVNPASAISGQPAFTGNSGGYIQSIVDLSTYSGDEIFIRFRFASDAFVGGEGWYIDNVELYTDLHAITNVACITVNGDDVCSEITTAVFGNSTSTKNIEEILDVAVFPNPTDGKLFIKMENNNNSATTFKLIGLDGRLLKTKAVDFSNGTFDFDLTGFPAGIYTLQIQTEDGQDIRKLVVE